MHGGRLIPSKYRDLIARALPRVVAACRTLPLARDQTP
jgi:hypothetical protein